MDATRRRLRQKQIDQNLRSTRDLPQPPRGGWIRSIRESLGMTAATLAERLGTSKQNVINTERSEDHGRISLSNLRKAADALNCDLVYAIVPRKPLAEFVHERAIHVAGERLASVQHTMSLEAQAVQGEELRTLIEDYAQKLIEQGDQAIWIP